MTAQPCTFVLVHSHKGRVVAMIAQSRARSILLPVYKNRRFAILYAFRITHHAGDDYDKVSTHIGCVTRVAHYPARPSACATSARRHYGNSILLLT